MCVYINVHYVQTVCDYAAFSLFLLIELEDLCLLFFRARLVLSRHLRGPFASCLYQSLIFSILFDAILVALTIYESHHFHLVQVVPIRPQCVSQFSMDGVGVYRSLLQ